MIRGDTFMPHDVNSLSRLRALIRANHAVVEQLELPVVLRRIVEAAVELVSADYGALGVIAPHGGLDQFIHVGMTDPDVSRIGHLPEGHGLLGALIDDPRPIRLERIAEDPRSAGFPEDHPPMGGFLGVPVRVRDTVYGNLYLSNHDDGGFSNEDTRLVMALAATAGVAIENARLFAETSRRQAWSAASAEITAALLSGEQSESIELLADRVLELSVADLVCVIVPSAQAGSLIVDVAVGLDDRDVRSVSMPIGESIASRVIEGRQPELVDDSDITLASGAELGPVMAVPLMAGGRAEGVLFVARKRSGVRFTTADLEMAADFAGQASVAMQLGKARSDRQRMLLLEDRGRIARDLHDHVIQQIFGTGLELQSIAGALQDAALAERINQSVTHLDESISQIRTVIFALSSPPDRASGTLRHTVIDLADELAPTFASPPRVTFTGPVDLLVTGTLAGDVMAVVREGLTNAARHAAASTVAVTVSAADGWIVVDVVDDGSGIGAVRRRSGLKNLAVRAESRGGSMDIDPDGLGTDQRGTHVRWSCPYSLVEA
jgi:signal transduction histidine kinase